RARFFAEGATDVWNARRSVDQPLGDGDRLIVEHIGHVQLVGDRRAVEGTAEQSLGPILEEQVEEGAIVAIKHLLRRGVVAGDVLALITVAAADGGPAERAGREGITRP